MPQPEDAELGQSKTGLNDDAPVVQSRWHTDDTYNSDWSIDEYGEADWATDTYTRFPPPLAASNDSGSKPLGGAEDSKNREELGRQSETRGKRKRQSGNSTVDVTTHSVLRKILFAIGLTVAAAVVVGTGFFIYRTDSAKPHRIAAADGIVAEEAVTGAVEARAATEAEEAASAAGKSSETEEKSRDSAEAAEAALVAAEAAEAEEEMRVAAEIAKAAEEARVADEEKKDAAQVAAEASKGDEDQVSDAAIVSSARAAAEAAEQKRPRPPTDSDESGISGTSNRLERGAMGTPHYCIDRQCEFEFPVDGAAENAPREFSAATLGTEFSSADLTASPEST